MSNIGEKGNNNGNRTGKLMVRGAKMGAKAFITSVLYGAPILMGINALVLGMVTHNFMIGAIGFLLIAGVVAFRIFKRRIAYKIRQAWTTGKGRK